MARARGEKAAMFFKESVDRSLIRDTHSQCVQQRRSLSHEFQCLSGLFGRRQVGRRDPTGQPRKYLLRHIENPLILRPRRVTMPPKRRVEREPEPPRQQQISSWSESLEEEPLERIVFQFAHYEPPDEPCPVYSRTEPFAELSVTEWALSEEEGGERVGQEDEEAALYDRQAQEEMEQMRERFEEYRRATATPPTSQEFDLDDELRSAQTMQIVVGANTIHCQ
jgi:hypothetical protein